MTQRKSDFLWSGFSLFGALMGIFNRTHNIGDPVITLWGIPVLLLTAVAFLYAAMRAKS